jgi:hypothetical protein
MRRSRLVTWAVVAALMLATVPVATAQAARPSPSTRTVFITICDFHEGMGWTVGRWAYYRGYWHTGNEFVLVGGQWVLTGTFRADTDNMIVGPNTLVTSGTFQVRDGLLGDYDGQYAWNYGKGKDGLGIGRGVGSSAGGYIKIDFLFNNEPVGLPEAPSDPCAANGYQYLITSTY